jgi:uncharacterized protein
MFLSRKIYQPDHIKIKESVIHGRGVFAIKNISKGTLIETAPAVFLSYDEKELLKQSPLFNYYFLVNNVKNPAVFGFGYSSFYNHSSRANAFYTFSAKRNTIRFYAYKKIMAGEEITINYNGLPQDQRPVYFPEHG